MADAELIVSPEIDRNRLNRTLRTIEQGFNRVSRNIGRSIEQSIRQGIERAGGARGIAGGVGRIGAQSLFGAAVAGLFASSTRADNITALYQQFLGQSTARDDLAFARAQGLETARYANFRRLGNRAGLDSSAINSLIFDTTARLGEARLGQDPLLNQFTQYSGVNAVGQILGAVAQENVQTQSRLLDDLYGGEAAIEAQRLIDLARQSGATTQQEIADFIAAEDTEAAKLLKSESQLTREYRDEQARREMDMRDAMLNALNKGDLELLLGAEQVEREKTLDQIAAYDANLKTKIAQDKIINATLTKLSTAVNKLVTVLDKIIPKTVDLPSPDSTQVQKTITEARTAQHEQNKIDGLGSQGADAMNEAMTRARGG